MKTAPEVLFVCVHNAGRSQMAAALPHHHAAGTVHVRSAGSAPADEINPAGKTLDQVRPIRTDIDNRVRALLAELGTADALVSGVTRGDPHCA